MVTNVCVKFNYDRLRFDKVLGNWKSDNNKKNYVRYTCGPFPSLISENETILEIMDAFNCLLT